MNPTLQRLQDLVFSHFNLYITDIEKDLECEEYSGFNFVVNNIQIKFRKAKITPTKTGQFVTLWKRNKETKKTEPFNQKDQYTFYIILTETDENFGFFFFTKEILIKNQIISSCSKVGKLGFRVYPKWDNAESKQALKTQSWQKLFFIDVADENFLKTFEHILKSQL